MQHLRSLNDFAEFIERFCANQTDSYELDDAVSIPADSPLLRRVQWAIAAVHEFYPDQSVYCSQEGIAKLKSLSQALRNSEVQTTGWLERFRSEHGE